jgi:enoyl reductase
LATALNPIDAKVRRGGRPVGQLPAGVGREFSGIVTEIGSHVTGLAVGDRVLGTGEAVMAEFVAVSAKMVMVIPESLDTFVAASLPVAPQTAWCAVDSQKIGPGDRVLVSAAAGGVGFVAAQLCIQRGATVYGTSSKSNAELLRSMGVVPIEYGPGLVERLREHIPEGITCVLDHHGSETIEAALELGISRERINSTSGLAERYGVPSVGRVGLDHSIMKILVDSVVAGTLSIPIDSVFALDDVVAAFGYLEGGHLHGKVVLEISHGGL